MSSSDITPGENWTGPFTWDGHFMRLHIKTVKHDYDADNPRTWPLIKDLTQTDNGSNYKKSRTPPARLAYAQENMDDMKQHSPLRYASKSSIGVPDSRRWISKNFVDYPFNYDHKGKPRDHPHLRENEMGEWLKVATPKEGPKPPPVGTTESDHVSHVSPEKAFEQIMQTLSDPDAELRQAKKDVARYRNEAKVALAKVDSTRKEFSAQARVFTKRAQVANDKQKAQFAKELDAEKAKTRLAQREASGLKVELEEAKAQAGVLGKEIGTCREEIKTKEVELAGANERIMVIWKEMQKGKDGGNGKRKPSPEVSGGQRPEKRAKT
jgi:hypothetical protein